jgi:hypothetical protein
MATTGACLSGSFALTVLLRRRALWSNSDLDVFVDIHGLERIIRWLTAVEEFDYRPDQFGVSWEILKRVLGRIRTGVGKLDLRKVVRAIARDYDADERNPKVPEEGRNKYGRGHRRNPRIDGVFRFVNESGKRVEVIIVTSTSLDAILGFHSSRFATIEHCLF